MGQGQGQPKGPGKGLGNGNNGNNTNANGCNGNSSSNSNTNSNTVDSQEIARLDTEAEAAQAAIDDQEDDGKEHQGGHFVPYSHIPRGIFNNVTLQLFEHQVAPNVVNEQQTHKTQPHMHPRLLQPFGH